MRVIVGRMLGVLVALAIAGVLLGHAHVFGVKRSAASVVIALLAAGVVATGMARRIGTVRELLELPSVVFSLVLIVYLANGRTLWSGDTVPARYLPISLLVERNFDLDEFPFLYTNGTEYCPRGCEREGRPPYFLQMVGGHYVSAYPVGAALLALPFYLLPVLSGLDPQSPFVEELEKLSAATIVAASAVMVYLTLRRLTLSWAVGAFITAIYAFGTSSWSVSSQALWQHGPSQLSLAAMLYCLVRTSEGGWWLTAAGFCAAATVVFRPPDAVIILPFVVYVLVRHRSGVVTFLLGGVPVVAFQAWYNLTVFGNAVHSQFPLPGIGVREWSGHFTAGFFGILLSPGRGLLLYSPIWLMALVRGALSWRKGENGLLRAATVGVVLSILLYSKWYWWWGGYTYGPRVLADLSPLLALMLSQLGLDLLRSRELAVVAVVLGAWSIGAHAIGAFGDVESWNSAVEVSRFPDRVWWLRNNQPVNVIRQLYYDVVRLARGG